MREFKNLLRNEEKERQATARAHQKDSKHRKQVKKERAKEKRRSKRNADDAERDQNHAIAHGSEMGERTAASFSPGAALVFVIFAGFCLKVMAVIRRTFQQGAGNERRGGLQGWDYSGRVGARSKRVRFQSERGSKYRTPATELAPFMGVLPEERA